MRAAAASSQVCVQEFFLPTTGLLEQEQESTIVCEGNTLGTALLEARACEKGKPEGKEGFRNRLQ